MTNLHPKEEVKKVRQACRVTAAVLAATIKQVAPGKTTEDLDSFAEKLIREAGGEPVFKGYRGFRHATCISVNEEIVHGIPGQRPFVEGDIVSVDVGVKIDGYCGDSAATVAVGVISKKAQRLIRATKEALQAAIRQAIAGNHLGDISAAIERVALKNGYSVVRDLFSIGSIARVIPGFSRSPCPGVPKFGISGSSCKSWPTRFNNYSNSGKCLERPRTTSRSSAISIAVSTTRSI